MPAKWTADVVSEMHLHRIERKVLAKQLGMTPEYISMVLNGHREPPNAEERFRSAVQTIIENRKTDSENILD